jgi:hypothetical protein
MKPQDLERLFSLLKTRDIPGTPEQLQLLFIRLGELTEINGREWIIRHRERLLSQWAAALGQKPRDRT